MSEQSIQLLPALLSRLEIAPVDASGDASTRAFRIGLRCHRHDGAAIRILRVAAADRLASGDEIAAALATIAPTLALEDVQGEAASESDTYATPFVAVLLEPDQARQVRRAFTLASRGGSESHTSSLGGKIEIRERPSGWVRVILSARLPGTLDLARRYHWLRDAAVLRALQEVRAIDAALALSEHERAAVGRALAIYTPEDDYRVEDGIVRFATERS